MDTLNQSVSEVLSENLQKVVDYWYNENSGIDRHSTTTKDVGLISLLKESINKGDEYSEYPIVKFMWEKLPESDMKVLKNLVKRERAESREADDEDVRMETMEFSEMSVEQFEQLEKRFCMEPYPTREERKEIAQMVGMSLEKVGREKGAELGHGFLGERRREARVSCCLRLKNDENQLFSGQKPWKTLKNDVA